MSNKPARRRKATGRSAATYLGIPHYVFRSDEFGQIDAWALKLLIELAGKYTGFNNGDLSCAFSQLSERGWNSRGTLDASIKHLKAARWIITTRHGGKNRCALYAVTWWPIDECPGKGLEVKAESVASNAWQKTKSLPAMRVNLPAMRANWDATEGLK